MYLNWSIDGEALLDAAIDQYVSITPSQSGSIPISSSQGRLYSFYSLTPEGGVFESVNTAVAALDVSENSQALAGLNLQVNRGYLPIVNSGGMEMVWNASTSTPGLFQIETTSGRTYDEDSVSFIINTDGRSPGTYSGYIYIDAGGAGSQNVLVTPYIFDELHHAYLPILHSSQ